MKLLLVLLALALIAALVAVLVQPFAGSAPRWDGPRADPEKLHALVRDLVALGPRHDAPGQARAAAWVEAQLGALGYAPVRQGYRSRDREYRNLYVTAGPAAAQRVIVSAHYDARGPFSGADDDASGVAGLLELARILRLHPPAGRVELAFYSNEEYGLLGSAAHAASIDPRATRAMISLEMIGYFAGPQRFPFAFLKWLYPTVGDFIAVVGRPREMPLTRELKHALRAGGIGVESINAPIPDVGRSDHASFWQVRVPAVMVTDTANFRNPNYHQAGDTPETLDYARMGQVVDGIAAWLSQVPR
ncbi:MAG: M28 family peptidase [Myxococcales bacterium]